MSNRDDDRVDVTCTTCGRQLKAPKRYAGQSLRCPKCKAMNMVPFGDVNGIDRAGPVEKGLAAAEAALRKASGESAGPSAGPAGSPGLVGAVSKHVPEIDTLLRSVYKCFEDGFVRAQNVLSDPALNVEKKGAELVRVKRDIAAGVRDHVLKAEKDIAEKVGKLRSHPMAKSVSIKAQLAEASMHQVAFGLFAKCVFDVKPQGEGAPPPGS